MRTLRTIISLILVMAMALFTVPLAAQDAAAGKKVYKRACASCHGSTGKGNGPAAIALDPKPADLTDGRLTGKTDDEIKKVILSGGAANGLAATMPAFKGQVSDAQIADVIVFLRGLEGGK